MIRHWILAISLMLVLSFLIYVISAPAGITKAGCSIIMKEIPGATCPADETHINDNASISKCSSYGSMNINSDLLSLFNDGYASLSQLEVTYSDCAGEPDCLGTSRYNCILRNSNVALLVYHNTAGSPEGCMTYDVLILPKASSLESVLKPEYSSLVSNGTFSMNVPCFQRATSGSLIEGCYGERRVTISLTDEGVIVKESHLNCP